LRVFTIDGTNEPCVVLLFPRESCSCPVRRSCYHITAARLSVGLSDSGTRRPLNLTQLRRNKRLRADKMSGQKRPRAGDVDIVPAGDVNEDVATALTCHHHGEPAAAAAATISNSCRHGTKQPTGAKFTYTNIQTGNAGRRHRQRRLSLRCL